jgi:hypothetical protein
MSALYDSDDLVLNIASFLTYYDLTHFCTINRQHKLIGNRLNYSFDDVKKLYKVLLMWKSQLYTRPRVNSWSRKVWDPTERFIFG